MMRHLHTRVDEAHEAFDTGEVFSLEFAVHDVGDIGAFNFGTAGSSVNAHHGHSNGPGRPANGHVH
eukprot:scaffold153616_cov50-Attheya_sp.AAC.3